MQDAIRHIRLQARLVGARVLITGAGTSAYAALAIASAWPCSVAVPSTDLLLDTERYIQDTDVLISIARSGDSPESIGALDRVHKLRPTIWHLAITCNAEGALARSPLADSITLDPRTNDLSLVMTSSFSNLVLAGLCLANGDAIASLIQNACKEAQTNLALINVRTREIACRVKDRVVVLASPPLGGWAQEAALKILEMTAGRFPVMADTYLGVRHGPMSFIRPDTLVVCLLSSDPVRRRYEEDLVRELRTKKIGYLVGISTLDGKLTLFNETIPAVLPDAADALRTPFEIIAPQLLGYHLSLRAGLNPDNPSPEGVISRVVQGVHIYAN